MTTSSDSLMDVYYTLYFQHWSKTIETSKLGMITRLKQGDTIVDVTRHELLTIRNRRTNHTLWFLSYGGDYV